MCKSLLSNWFVACPSEATVDEVKRLHLRLFGMATFLDTQLQKLYSILQIVLLYKFLKFLSPRLPPSSTMIYLWRCIHKCLLSYFISVVCLGAGISICWWILRKFISFMNKSQSYNHHYYYCVHDEVRKVKTMLSSLGFAELTPSFKLMQTPACMAVEAVAYRLARLFYIKFMIRWHWLEPVRGYLMSLKNVKMWSQSLI